MFRLSLVVCWLLSPLSSWAHPGHSGLIPLDDVQTLERRALNAKDAADLSGRITGSWKINGYRLWSGQSYMEVPVKKETPETVAESWLFRANGQFRHVMGGSLWFTGQWEIIDGLWRHGATDEGHSRGYFLIRTSKVQTSFGQVRAEEYFAATFVDGWRDLAIFYLGKDPSSMAGYKQASAFGSAPYGER